LVLREHLLAKTIRKMLGGETADEIDAAHVNAMIAMVEAEAVTAAPDLRDWLMSLAAFARRAADRHVGVVFVLS
jgi:hypothetical protein